MATSIGASATYSSTLNGLRVMPQLLTAVVVFSGVFATTQAADYFVRVKEVGNAKVPIFLPHKLTARIPCAFLSRSIK
jgi:hypothetical protein